MTLSRRNADIGDDSGTCVEVGNPASTPTDRRVDSADPPVTPGPDESGRIPRRPSMAVRSPPTIRCSSTASPRRLDERRAGSRSAARRPASSSGASRPGPRRTSTAPSRRPGRRSATGAGRGWRCPSGSPSMNRLADLLDAHADELARLETLQTGTAYKLRRESDFAFASRQPALLRRPDPPPRGQGRLRVQRQPHELRPARADRGRRPGRARGTTRSGWRSGRSARRWRPATRSSSSRPARRRSRRSAWPSWPPRPASRPASSTS